MTLAENNNASVQETPQTCCCTQGKHHGKHCLLAGLILGLLAAGILWVVSSPQQTATVSSVLQMAASSKHAATAALQIRATKPQLLFEGPGYDQHEYNTFVNTQLHYMRSPIVLDRVLEKHEVADLPIVRKQKDKRDWLASALQIERVRDSEIVHVSIDTHSLEESAKIVDAVVESYFQFIDELDREARNTLISSLRVEERRQRQIAQQLQEIIRTKTKDAALQSATTDASIINASLVQDELLMREIALAETKMLSLRAQRKAITERIEQPPTAIPVAVSLAMNPELKSLQDQRIALEQRRDLQMEQQRDITDDPRIAQLNRQINAIEERIGNLATGAGLEAVQNELRLQLEVQLFQIEQEIKIQEILIEELTGKHNEQLEKRAELIGNVVDVSYETAQLERTNKTLDKIEDRILAVSMEQRAPGRITQLSRATSSVAHPQQ